KYKNKQISIRFEVDQNNIIRLNEIENHYSYRQFFIFIGWYFSIVKCSYFCIKRLINHDKPR
ncbi:MAG: hypothetical protein ACTSSO_02630, partial [Candidatus Hodarchaeales archaeon]